MTNSQYIAQEEAHRKAFEKRVEAVRKQLAEKQAKKVKRFFATLHIIVAIIILTLCSGIAYGLITKHYTISGISFFILFISALTMIREDK